MSETQRDNDDRREDDRDDGGEWPEWADNWLWQATEDDRFAVSAPADDAAATAKG